MEGLPVVKEAIILDESGWLYRQKPAPIEQSVLTGLRPKRRRHFADISVIPYKPGTFMNARTIFTVDDHSAIDDQHDHEVTIFRAMAHPDRYRVLKILAAEGEMQVGQINEWIALGQSALSQHLKVLRDAGLVNTRKDSQRVFYSFRKSQGASLPQSMAALFG